MAYYDNFLDTTNAPKTDWIALNQSLIDEEFDNASTIHYDVYVENTFGQLDFSQIDCRVTTLVDTKTGQRINDDYRKLIFQSMDYDPPIGTRYRFSNNIWILFSTDNIKTLTTGEYIRRCNNTMNTQNYYGVIHQEPCYIDYKVTETQLDRGYTLDVPSGRIWVQCQSNSYTNSIDINDRFVFGRQVYKVRQFTDNDRRETFNSNSVYTLQFYADVDNKGEYDNLTYEVADYQDIIFTIETPDEISGIMSTTGQISYNVLRNGELTANEGVTWISSNPEIATVNSSGEYTLVSDGNCVFTGVLDNNSIFTTTINVVVSSTIASNYTYEISPSTRKVYLSQSQIYEIYEYNNGIKDDATFEFTLNNNGIPSSYYTFTINNNNSFTILNKKKFKDLPLEVTCRSSVTQENSAVIQIYLGGLS